VRGGQRSLSATPTIASTRGVEPFVCRRVPAPDQARLASGAVLRMNVARDDSDVHLKRLRQATWQVGAWPCPRFVDGFRFGIEDRQRRGWQAAGGGGREDAAAGRPALRCPLARFERA
jgi:hypothetical protein